MPIRFSRSPDIPELVAFGARMEPLTWFAAFHYDGHRGDSTLAAVMHKASRRHGCLVAEGASGITLAFYSRCWRNMFSLMWWWRVSCTSRSCRRVVWGAYGLRLLRAFEERSVNRQVREIQFGITSQLEMVRVAKLPGVWGIRRWGRTL